jgi:hypothetical protein
MKLSKKFSLLKYYKTVLDANRTELKSKFNIKIDKIYRMYTIYAVPVDDYNVYGDTLVDKEVGKYLSKLETYLNGIGLSELFEYTEIVKISPTEFRIVVNYKLLDTFELATITRIAIITFIASATVSFVLFGLAKLFL